MQELKGFAIQIRHGKTWRNLPEGFSRQHCTVVVGSFTVSTSILLLVAFDLITGLQGDDMKRSKAHHILVLRHFLLTFGLLNKSHR